MLSSYPNLGVDISWVVWEDVICDDSGTVKQNWVDCIQKHHTRFYIGSDNVKPNARDARSTQRPKYCTGSPLLFALAPFQL